MGDEVELEREVLDDRQLDPEADLLDGAAPERDRGPVEPVPVQQRGGQRLAREDGAAVTPRPEEPLLDGVGQPGRRRPRLVDDADPGLDHDRLGHGREGVEDHADVVREQDVVAAEEDDVLLRRPGQALAVVRGDAEVGLVPHHGDARVVESAPATR